MTTRRRRTTEITERTRRRISIGEAKDSVFNIFYSVFNIFYSVFNIFYSVFNILDFSFHVEMSV